MGKGDKKTGKGKRAQGSYGITRQRKKTTSSPITAPKVEKVKVVEKVEKPKKTVAAKKTTEKKVSTAKKTTKKDA